MNIDNKTISAGLAAIGLLALAATGYVNITTPEAQQCMVDLADAKARLELHTQAMDACKTALKTCAGD
jgi:hypothetical protein